ncbi:site-specific DNA-methyltransferase, partial [Amycolatopsis sp. NPDC000740]|uniref:DNA-methyltransferase n=1 Tax=Amycolatopsis sp. NPDC000740 TaxID=3154269 RepID=UPI00331A02DB
GQADDIDPACGLPRAARHIPESENQADRPDRPLRESVRLAGVSRTRSLPRKNLVGMPWRVAFALQSDGWILRNAIVWHKPNAMPESVRDRVSNRYEMLFLLTKQQKYFFDLDPIREPLARPEAVGEGSVIGGANKGRYGGIGATARRRGHSVYGKYRDAEPFAGKTPGDAMRPTGARHTAAHARGKNPGDVWSIPTRPLREAHFAAFPVDIPLRCIAAGCPSGGVVLDPFSGAATTGLAARQLGRSYLGIDLNPEFHAIGLRRLGLSDQNTGRAA